MPQPRTVAAHWASVPAREGAGVQLRRAFGFSEAPRLDPFLLLDDFRGDDPADYQAGFPWHPHRGIETITYILAGEVDHSDSMGNAGVIGPGDVQWMTAGSGIIHQEMPRGNAEGVMGGFQLWANLPAAQKMMPPRYREVPAATIPVVEVNGAQVRIVCGTVAGVSGPVRDIVTDPEYLDVTVAPHGAFTHRIPRGYNAFAYVFSGQGRFDDAGSSPLGNREFIHFSDGEEVAITAGNDGVRFLLVSGKPIGEPVAWQGPIVMNTQEELRLAFREFHEGTFIKERGSL